MSILCTSLDEIKSFHPCMLGWKDILVGQGKLESDDVSFPLVDCLKSNDVEDVLWLLKHKKLPSIAIDFAQDCVDSIAEMKTDYWYREALVYLKHARANAEANRPNNASYHASSCVTAVLNAVENSACLAGLDFALAREKQREKHKQFLANRIEQYQEQYHPALLK